MRRKDKNKLYVLDHYKNKTINEISKQLQEDVKKTQDILIELDKKEVTLSNEYELNDLFTRLRDKSNLLVHILHFIKNTISKYKREYIIVIFLNNGKIRAFKTLENPTIEGYYFEKNYYNIDSKCVIRQNKDSVLFYKENIPSPINFLKSNYIDDSFDLELSGQNMKRIVDGSAFKGIVNLGKDDFWKFFDWKMGVIALGIIVLFYLQYTGQIDLGQMLSLN